MPRNGAIALILAFLVSAPAFGMTLNANAVVCANYRDAALLAEMLEEGRPLHRILYYANRHCHRAPLPFEITVLEATDNVSKIRLNIDGSEWCVVDGSY